MFSVRPTMGDVLRFAADAQVDNWLSWQDLAWSVGGRAVTGPELLGRTNFYKVGHHGSPTRPSGRRASSRWSACASR